MRLVGLAVFRKAEAKVTELTLERVFLGEAIFSFFNDLKFVSLLNLLSVLIETEPLKDGLGLEATQYSEGC